MCADECASFASEPAITVLGVGGDLVDRGDEFGVDLGEAWWF